MSCERHTSAIVDHACGAEIAADAAAHLEACDACGRMFDEQLRLLQDLDHQLEEALAIQPSARFVPDVLARVERPAFGWRKMLWWSPAAATAAAVLMLVTFGSLRSGEQRSADRPNPAASSRVSSAPVAGHTPSEAVPPTRPEAMSRPTVQRRRAALARGVVERPSGVEPHVLVPAAQSLAIARYLALVRRGELDTSALARSNETDIVVPTDLVIPPLSVEDLAGADVDNGIGPDVDRRGPESR
jgi:hypothetical protein